MTLFWGHCSTCRRWSLRHLIRAKWLCPKCKEKQWPGNTVR